MAILLQKFYLIILKIKVFKLFYRIIDGFTKNILVSKSKKVNFEK